MCSVSALGHRLFCFAGDDIIFYIPIHTIHIALNAFTLFMTFKAILNLLFLYCD